MKLTTLINSAQIIAYISLLSGANRNKTATNNNSFTSTNVATNSNNLRSYYPQNINYLQPFDTAFLAYQMMGLNTF
ncbi:hypothetical protein NIES4074_39940 [Cylindrospermum sp. NIES-4074]|nr:hypothetical protein NIES4074_39940 [Cylindrospermum sp. NIES-4074]